MKYRTFYCDVARDEELAVDGAVMQDEGDIILLMDRVLTSHGSYVGLLDGESRVLQFLVGEQGELWIDFPVPKKRGSYMKRGDMEACREVLRLARGEFEHERVESLVFDRW